MIEFEGSNPESNFSFSVRACPDYWSGHKIKVEVIINSTKNVPLKFTVPLKVFRRFVDSLDYVVNIDQFENVDATVDEEITIDKLNKGCSVRIAHNGDFVFCNYDDTRAAVRAFNRFIKAVS